MSSCPAGATATCGQGSSSGSFLVSLPDILLLSLVARFARPLRHLLPGKRGKRRNEPSRVDLNGGRVLLSPLALAEGIQVSLPRYEELQKAHPLVPARLIDAQQHQVVLQPPFLQQP